MPPATDPDALAAQHAAARKRLNRAWFMFLAAGIIAMALVFGLLRGQWQAGQLKGWFLITALALFYELRIFKQALPLMHFPGEEQLADRVGSTVALSLVAGLGYGLLAGLLMVPQPAGALGWLATGLALAAVAADAWADRRNREARVMVGERYLAREFRALGALVITVVVIHYGKLPSWFIAVGFMEYLMLFTVGWLARKGEAIPSVDSRPRITFLFTYLVAVSVGVAPVIGETIALPLGVMFGLGYALVALRDWLILSGVWRRGES